MGFPLFCATRKVSLPPASNDRGAESVTLKEYVFGRRIVLQAPIRKDKAAERIKQAVGSAFSPFHHGVAGGFYFGNLRLAWSIPLFGNGFRPVLSGRLVERGSKSELHASYGAPWFLLIFWAFWYVLLAAFMVTVLRAALLGGVPADLGWLFIGAWMLFCLLPIAFHLIFNVNANKHFDAMLDVHEREAGFVELSKDAAPSR